MILRSERGGEGSQIRAEHFEAARVELAQSRFTLHYVKRGAALRSCFGQGKTTRREIERSQRTLRLQLDAWVAPVQTSGNHQVQHQPKVTLQADGDALSEAPQLLHSPAFHFRQGRTDGTQEERARDPHALEPLAKNPLVE